MSDSNIDLKINGSKFLYDLSGWNEITDYNAVPNEMVSLLRKSPYHPYKPEYRIGKKSKSVYTEDKESGRDNGFQIWYPTQCFCYAEDITHWRPLEDYMRIEN